MKQMWAPWRMEYIGESMGDGCFLCRYFAEPAGRDEANLVVRRGARCAVVMNRYPYSNGHLMVAPYRHAGTLDALEADEQADMMALASWCTRALGAIMKPHGFNIGINQGLVAGAGLKDHIHLHVVPRWNGDTNFMPVFGEVKVIPQALEDVWTLLRDVEVSFP
jgi:ATP adenylyltransferase